MLIQIPRQVHGKYGTLNGRVDMSRDVSYAKALIKSGLANAAPKATKPARKSKED